MREWTESLEWLYYANFYVITNFMPHPRLSFGRHEEIEINAEREREDDLKNTNGQRSY